MVDLQRLSSKISLSPLPIHPRFVPMLAPPIPAFHNSHPPISLHGHLNSPSLVSMAPTASIISLTVTTIGYSLGSNRRPQSHLTSGTSRSSPTVLADSLRSSTSRPSWSDSSPSLVVKFANSIHLPSWRPRQWLYDMKTSSLSPSQGDLGHAPTCHSINPLVQDLSRQSRPPPHSVK